MSGNVAEWCWDWYGDYTNTNVTNPTGVTTGLFRIARGGSWDSTAEECSNSYRACNYPGNVSPEVGIRLVKSIK